MRLEELKGCWALVTGASSGIGQEFAVQLAAAGLNLVLVARRAELLRSLESKLSEQHDIRTLALPVDLAELGQAERLRQHLEAEGVSIRLLVNNAAIGCWASFDVRPAVFYEEMIRVNAAAPVSLCREFLSQLASHPGSAIINVSSAAAFQPIPYMAVYAASKAFLRAFSLALHEEWRPQGVSVQTLLPGPTPTDLEGAKAGGKGGRQPAEVVVRASLRRLDHPVVTTARGTLLQRLFALLPSRLVLHQVGRMFLPPE